MLSAQAVAWPEEAPTHSYRVLVVDDNEPSAKTMMWTMEMLGHTAQIALDGQSALSLARSFHPDVVLLDIGLPGMDGYETCEAMRREPALQHTVFVAQTGWSQKEHYERSKAAGFDYHLVKPVDMNTLNDVLQALKKATPSDDAALAMDVVSAR